MRDLYKSVTGCTNVSSISVSEGMSRATAQATITCRSTTLVVGSEVDIDIGYADEHAVIMLGGIVKSIRTKKPSFDIEVQVADVLDRAVEFFIAPDDPEHPYQVINRKAEDVVVDMLALAGITGAVVDTTIFTLGVDTAGSPFPVDIKLVSAWNVIENLNRICGFLTYAEPSTGVVHFSERKPYIVGGDASVHTFATGVGGDILEVDYRQSDEITRNRVAVYGYNNIHSVSSGSSPYLPSDMTKSMVVAHDLITNQQTADDTAALNLEMFNRLDERCIIKALGLPSLHPRQIVDVDDPIFTGLSPGYLWVVFDVTHRLGQSGYSVDVTLVR